MRLKTRGSPDRLPASNTSRGTDGFFPHRLIAVQRSDLIWINYKRCSGIVF